MLDFGFAELLLVMAVAVLVIGPGEIPRVMHTLGRIVRRIQYIRYAFSQQFDEFMQDNDLDDIRRSVNFEEKDFDEAAADEEDPALSLVEGHKSGREETRREEGEREEEDYNG